MVIVMARMSRVVVGVDGSASSRTALRWALAEAQVHGATLQVVHAWRTPVLFVPDAYDPALVEVGRTDEAALRFIDGELDAIGADDQSSVAIEATAVEGSAARALVDASPSADLVVLGRHGLGGSAHDLLAPTVIQVAHHASCSVAVVPDTWLGDGLGVVVGVDGSPPSLDALRWAVPESAGRCTTLTALMAWGLLDQHNPDSDTPFDPHYGSDDAQSALDSYVNGALRGQTCQPLKRTIVNDLPARALIDASSSAELLVVGARGLGGFAGLLLGSVSHRCLERSACPTIVVRRSR